MSGWGIGGGGLVGGEVGDKKKGEARASESEEFGGRMKWRSVGDGRCGGMCVAWWGGVVD